MRVLTRENLSKSGARHVFLLHNGLNETRDISFHYRLASWILNTQKNAACIIRPLPGHFSRYFFQSPFAELPLDEYLQDPAAVFRQFLRYMLETQWLLSTLVPWNDYDVTTGCELLLYGKKKGRTDAAALAHEIMAQANRTLQASKERSDELGQTDAGYSPQPLKKRDVLDCVVTLRQILGWSAADPNTRPGPRRINKPAIHAVGYSMGGFIAQSVFCAWPFAVASCSNLFAGGALRDLAPTAFAHPEEWQSVLHGLRSELDRARVEQRLSPSYLKGDTDEKFVVGIKRRTFEYFERVFENVFLQSDRGSYSTRLAEFSRRLLFILGGDDPIVRTRNVLDAAPPGGITLHQIGDVSHFQDSKHKEPAEMEQRDFWLPEVGGMIGRFAERSAGLLQKTHSQYWQSNKSSTRASGTSDRSKRLKRQPDGGLANLQFEDELDSMINMIDESGGWLFIARSQIPTVFLEKDAFRAHAGAMHHAEDLVGLYADGLKARAKRLDKLKERFTLLIPSAQVLGDANHMSDSMKPPDTARDRAMFSKSEVAIRYWPDDASRRQAWGYFLDTWCRGEAVRSVKESEYLPYELGQLGTTWRDEHDDEGATEIAVTMLPDVWIAFDQAACSALLETKVPNTARKSAGLRSEIEDGMLDLAGKLALRASTGKDDELKRFLTMGGVRAVKVSAAEFNPRYRGRLLDGSSRETSGVAGLLIHWAMAYEASCSVKAC